MPDNAIEYAKQFNLDYKTEREPYYKFNDNNLKFTLNWVQNYNNQKALFDCFFEHINPLESLSFFMLKKFPF